MRCKTASTACTCGPVSEGGAEEAALCARGALGLFLGAGRAERERRASSTLYMSPTGAADGGHYFMAGMQTTSPTLDAVGMLERVRGDGRG